MITTTEINSMFESESSIASPSTQEDTSQILISKLGIKTGNITLICGSGASGKTLLCQLLACCVASGISAFNSMKTIQASVLHIDQEQSQVQTQKRYNKILSGLNLSNDLPIKRVKLSERIKCDDASIAVAKTELSKIFKDYKFIIIDSLKAISTASDSSINIEKILKMFKALAEECGCAIVIIHHMGKNNVFRGSTTIRDSVDLQYNMKVENKIRYLWLEKDRDNVGLESFSFTMEDAGTKSDDGSYSKLIFNQNFKKQEQTTIAQKSPQASKPSAKQTIPNNGLKLLVKDIIPLVPRTLNSITKLLTATKKRKK